MSGTLNTDTREPVFVIELSELSDITGLEKVVVYKTGNLHGNVHAPSVTLKDGADF